MTEQHRPIWEENLPGQYGGWICELDNEDWPCEYEQELTREPPERRYTMTNLYEDDDLLTPSEVAALFSVSSRTVTRWTNEGKIAAAVRTLGGHRRYRYSDVAEAERAIRER